MCGIAGYVDRAGRHPRLAADLELAVGALRHRGPNDQGTWLRDAGVGLGQTRLSILDLSSNGHQPMVSEDGQVVMAFNGEVYNFAAIRPELEALGHHFKGSGDSEVVLAAFRQWGMAAVDRFIGMFAIALWDRATRTLHLLRDRLGVKPLYYGWDGETLWFASELKALRQFGQWTPAIDQQALAEYLQFGYINAPRSIYRQVSKLEPGHHLTLAPQGAPQLQRYWSVLDALKTPLQGSEQELSDQLEALMEDAFALRMVADVPVGVFLSGGVDSSLVAALLQKRRGTPLHTFTIGFSEARVDESPHARKVAEHLGTVHTERIMQPHEARDLLPQWGQLFDEPFFDSSGLPTYLVSRMAGEQVTVVLSADGGDESFSGYGVYDFMLAKWRQRAALPAPLLAALRALLALLPIDGADRLVTRLPLPRALRHLLRHRLIERAIQLRDVVCARSLGQAYEAKFSIWRARELATLVAGYAPVRASADDYPGTPADQMGLWDLHHYLPGDVLAKVDRTTMAVGLEGREPLLDHRIVEFAFRLPLAMRRGALGTKHALRRILYKYVPRELIERPKMGFAIPLREWLRGDLAHLIDQHLAPERLRAQGIFRPEQVAAAVAAFRAGDDRMTNRVWSVLAFQLWHERWA
ncbi:asparagine synthase (glutamine-hydrolyzing) [Duganella sp. BJB488]|uniref:asparagine synthase (glutamine-hydrolyzing) n=1 Tax=unclassified Duganella TaxID=2636909 RepID=UPI000E349528|nr:MULTISPECIES: asparagine synthase (glutamine-hydrolyzing) [unclassified Duganella]RFP12397.1 asparagine synthase (glutamine-hydrolyzing) [Duganella sp. BJB489]RFP16509.1 asparagine synthase (glutamine-hydrolyzing) [Duganella sp. BJB488]RFP30761.1 asparagine synthase (glutamine-hydrolyzing) [Duganella sp. BJB480]